MPQLFYKKIKNLEYFQPTPWNNNGKNYTAFLSSILLNTKYDCTIYIYTYTHIVTKLPAKKRTKEKYCSAAQQERRIAIYKKRRKKGEKRKEGTSNAAHVGKSHDGWIIVGEKY